MPSGDAHRSLARALDILELCSLNGSGYTLTQLSQHLGIAKGSISPLLHTLRDRGYLTLDDQDHHYRIGRMAFRIGNTYLDEASALREIYRLMHDIVSVCHETCHLGSLKNGDVYYLKKVESPLYSHTVTVEGRSLPGLRHRRGQGSAGRLPAAPAQGPVLRRPVPADRAHHHRLPPPGRPAGRDPGQRLCLRV